MLTFSSFKRAFRNIASPLFRSTSHNRSRKPLFISLAILALLVPTIFLYLQFARTTSAAWYNASWLYRKELVFNNTASGTNLTDFPVMVKLTSANFNFSQAQSAGQDLRFTDSDGSTLLSYEIEKFDVSGSEAIIWVKVPQIDSASATDSIYVYWGNNAASDSQSADNTWNTNYKGVYHLKDNAASTTVTDSSGNTNSITSYVNTNANMYQSASQIAGGIIAGGTPTYITNQSGNNYRELYPDIALDSSGFPVIVFYIGTDLDLVLVHCNDKECKGNDETVNVVDSSNNTGAYPSIQLDSNGYPMIAYQYVTGLDLKYVHCNDVNCAGNNETFTTIESTNSVGYYPRMVLDASGYPSIIHYSATNTELRLYICSNADCSAGTAKVVDSAGTVGNGMHSSDIVLTATGSAVMSYYDTTNTELKVATCIDATCTGVTTHAPLSSMATSNGLYTAIELDGSGLPMIAYYNTTNTDLDFLHCDDVLCFGNESANRLMVNANGPSFPSLEKDSSGLPVIIATGGFGIYPDVFRCANTSCSTNTVTRLSEYDQYATGFINFKMDASNNLYAVGQSRGKTGEDDALFFNSTHKLERAYDADFDFGTSSFSVSTWFKSNGMVQDDFLLSRYDADQGFKLRLDSAGRPCFEIDDDATWNPDDSACATDPQVVTNLDNGNASGPTYNEVVLDSSGFPVIAYFDGGSNDLELIHCNDVNCLGYNENYANVEVTNNVGSYLSMVLDSSGFPAIAYQDLTTSDLRIVRCGNANCSASNVGRTIDSGGNVGVFPSLKLDSSGYPVIAYTDTTNTSVKLMHCNDNTCDPTVNGAESTQTVSNVSSDQTRSNQALLLDGSGFPMIVFSDQTSDDLEYVHCNDVNCDPGVGGAETLVTIETTNQVGEFAAMVLDSSGFPVIAHTDLNNSTVRIVHCGNADCNSGNTTNSLITTNAGDFGYYEIDIQLNSSGYPVLLTRQLPTFGHILTACNDVNCSGDNETHSLIRDDRYMTAAHGLALDSSGFPVISYTSTGADVRLIHMTSATTFIPQGDYDDSAWHHLVGVKNGTTSLTLYLDGVAVATDSSIAATGTLTSNSATLNLAEEIDTTHSVKNWSGYMDEVQLDTTARSSDWVKAQYKSESNTFINQGTTELRYAVNLGIFTNNTGAIKNNLVAHYKFDEGFGTTSNNSGSIGPAVNATLTNGPQWRNDGKFGKAIVLDGEYTNSDDYVTIPDHNSLDVQTGPFTVSAWINRQGATAVGGGNHQPIVGKARSAVTYTYLLLLNSTGTLSLGLYDGTNNPGATSITAITSPGWHHVVGVYDGTSVLVYIDGKLENTASAGSFAGTATTGTTEIGVWPLQHSTRGHFNGLIDDVKIYNDALTADEIKQDYNKKSSISFGSLSDTSALSGGSVASNSASSVYCVPGASDSCAPPVAEWKFEEASWTNNCSTATAMDTSGNGNSLTSCPNGSGQTAGGVGKYGKATMLDGTDDYFESTSAQLNLSGAITMEAWVKPTATSINDDYFINRTNANAGYAFGWASAMNPKVRIGNGTSYTDVTGTTTLTVGTWYHLVATIDGSGNAIIYVNGKVDTTSTTGVLATATQNFRIGTRGAGNEIAAVIDEVKLFNYVRTPAQIVWDMNQGKPIVHYKFDDCTGTSLKDSSGNAKHATITIGATGGNTTSGTCTTSGAWFDGAVGKFNASLDFDGTDDQAISDEPTGAYNFEQDFTASIWIKTTASTGTIFHKATASGGTIFMLDNSSGIIRFSRYDGEFSPSAYSTTVTNTGTWTHILATKKDSVLTLYVNAKPEAIITDEITGGGSGTDFTTYLANSSAGVHYFAGQLDDARVYNYALTPTQIKNVYNEGSSVRFGL